MKVFLITVGVFCVLQTVPPPPWLTPPITQWLEQEAKERQVCSVYEERERLVKRIEALSKSILARRSKLKKLRNLE